MCELQITMKLKGYHVVLLETGRPDIAQSFYYITGASKKTGLKGDIGNHQFVTNNGNGACDIGFIEIATGKQVFAKELFAEAHFIWETKYGGRKMIIFSDGSADEPHFEDL